MKDKNSDGVTLDVEATARQASIQQVTLSPVASHALFANIFFLHGNRIAKIKFFLAL
jgi:hypothetical protein